MAITPYRKVRVDDNVLRQMQDAIEMPIRDISKRAILDGQLLEGVALLSSADNVVNHKLGKTLTGWLVVRQNASSIIWDDQAANGRPQDYLILKCSANVTISLWVF